MEKINNKTIKKITLFKMLVILVFTIFYTIGMTQIVKACNTCGYEENDEPAFTNRNYIETTDDGKIKIKVGTWITNPHKVWKHLNNGTNPDGNYIYLCKNYKQNPRPNGQIKLSTTNLFTDHRDTTVHYSYEIFTKDDLDPHIKYTESIVTPSIESDNKSYVKFIGNFTLYHYVYMFPSWVGYSDKYKDIDEFNEGLAYHISLEDDCTQYYKVNSGNWTAISGNSKTFNFDNYKDGDTIYFYTKSNLGFESAIASYTIKKWHTITLNNQSATSSGTTVVYEKYDTGYFLNKNSSTTVTSITKPTKTGYTFGGYYTSTNGNGTQCINASGKIIVSDTYFTSDDTLYAKWTPSSYTLTIDPNGGTYINSSGNKSTSKFTTTILSSHGYYAVSSISTTTGVTSPSSDTGIRSGYYISKPTRVGYTFDGWYVGNTKLSSIAFGAGSMYGASNPKTNVTATAKWIANKYTVNYYNGSTKIGSSEHIYGGNSNLTTWSNLGGTIDKAWSNMGWEFVGWSANYPSSGISYTNGQSIATLVTNGNGSLNLYAVYKRTITFKSGSWASTKNTTTQYWNPYNGPSNYITSITTPTTLTSISNWSAKGWRNDSKPENFTYATNYTFTPAAYTSPTYYGIYERTIYFKSGVNASVNDKNAIQYLSSNEGMSTSSITSGMPSVISNWTVLGYRNDTNIGVKQYNANTSINPIYNTGNIFYATYSRLLTIKYDGNGTTYFPTTGSVANTTSTIYMNAYSTTTSSQSVVLNANNFKRIGFKFTKWDIGNAGASYNPNLLYNHNTFVVVAKAEWKHDDSGIATMKTPLLKVNNPNDKGIYYNDGIYFVKGDGETIIELYGEAVLNPELITRIDKLSLNNGENVLTSNPKYTETYNITVPKNDVWNLVYNKSNVTNYNTYTNLFKTSGSPTIVNLEQGKFSFTQKFTISGRKLEEPYIGARTCCMYESCTNSSHTINMYGNSVRLHGDPYNPYAYIIDEKSNKVNIDAYDTKWTNQKKVTIELKDDDSGIKYYKLTKGTTTLKEVKNTSYVGSGNIILNLEEGAVTYTLYIVDNVGNEITYTFTPHIDRTTPTLTDLVDFKVMGDGNVPQNKNEIYAGTTNTWPTTNKDVTWEYNWQFLKELKYKATDDRSGFKKVVVTHYKQDSSCTTSWKKETLVNVSGDVLTAPMNQLITSFNGNDNYLEGKSYLTIELEDLAGNKTNVKLVVRRDSKVASITNAIATPPSLENYTMEQLKSIFASGDMSIFKTNIRFSINDNDSTKDTSGIKKVEILVKDAKTGKLLETHDVTSNLVISSYTAETNGGSSRFEPLVRPLSGTINVNIDALKDYPEHTYLEFYCKVTDYTENVTIKNALDGGKTEIPNYSIKTVMYSTKDKAYNITSLDKKTNTPYFKTGEVGFVEIWSIGYVDKFELDFSDGNIGKEMNDDINNGLIAPKYKLGVHGALPNQARFIKDLSAFKVNTNYPDVDGVSFASYISYTFDEVNNSMGTSGIDGWNEKGTMIRIPTNHELVTLNKLDKYGNPLYKWETHLARVYPYKKGTQGNPSGSYYTIWDNSSDDLHFRITHLLFGY